MPRTNPISIELQAAQNNGASTNNPDEASTSNSVSLPQSRRGSDRYVFVESQNTLQNLAPDATEDVLPPARQIPVITNRPTGAQQALLLEWDKSGLKIKEASITTENISTPNSRTGVFGICPAGASPNADTDLLAMQNEPLKMYSQHYGLISCLMDTMVELTARSNTICAHAAMELLDNSNDCAINLCEIVEVYQYAEHKKIEMQNADLYQCKSLCYEELMKLVDFVNFGMKNYDSMIADGFTAAHAMRQALLSGVESRCDVVLEGLNIISKTEKINDHVLQTMLDLQTDCHAGKTNSIYPKYILRSFIVVLWRALGFIPRRTNN